jgi:hypothetical protein
VHAYAGPLTYNPVPLPQPPVVLTVDNLQQPQTTISGPIDESTPVPPRPPVGFLLTWLPPVVGGLMGIEPLSSPGWGEDGGELSRWQVSTAAAWAVEPYG